MLRKPRSHAEIYNDLDGEIVNLFRVYRDLGHELKEKIRLTPFAREEFLSAYEPSDDPLEQARRTLVKSAMGFGSAAVTQKSRTSQAFRAATGFRANSNLSGTTPAHDWANYPIHMDAIIARLCGCVIENRDAKEVMLQQDSDVTLHYVDPPYVHETRAKSSRYSYMFEMSDEDHAELGDFLKQLKGAVIISGYPSDLYDEIYGSWQCVTRNAHADGARDRVECLWFNPKAAEINLFQGAA